MSEIKWEVGETYKDASNPAGVTEITDGSGYVVAFVPRHMGSARADSRNSFPHMIAAAPEMRDVIRRLIERWEELESHEATMHEFSCTVQDARNALAKAVQP